MGLILFAMIYYTSVSLENDILPREWQCLSHCPSHPGSGIKGSEQVPLFSNKTSLCHQGLSPWAQDPVLKTPRLHIYLYKWKVLLLRYTNAQKHTCELRLGFRPQMLNFRSSGGKQDNCLGGTWERVCLDGSEGLLLLGFPGQLMEVNLPSSVAYREDLLCPGCQHLSSLAAGWKGFLVCSDCHLPTFSAREGLPEVGHAMPMDWPRAFQGLPGTQVSTGLWTQNISFGPHALHFSPGSFVSILHSTRC